MGLDHGWINVDSIRCTDETKTVYNMRVEIDHTYFVGDLNWNFAVWVHNDYNWEAGKNKPYYDYLDKLMWQKMVRKLNGEKDSIDASIRKLRKEYSILMAEPEDTRDNIRIAEINTELEISDFRIRQIQQKLYAYEDKLSAMDHVTYWNQDGRGINIFGNGSSTIRAGSYYHDYNATHESVNNQQAENIKAFFEGLIESIYQDFKDTVDVAEACYSVLSNTITTLFNLSTNTYSTIKNGISSAISMFDSAYHAVLDHTPTYSDIFKSIKEFFDTVYKLSEENLVILFSGNTRSISLSDIPAFIKVAFKSAAEMVEYLKSQLYSAPTQKAVSYVIGVIAGAFIFEAIAGTVMSVASAGVGAALRGSRFLPALINKLKKVDFLKDHAHLIDRASTNTARILSMVSCFPAGTPVHTLKGLKNIEDIVPGDIVLTRPETADETFTEAIYKPVLNTFVTRPRKLLHIEYSTNKNTTESISTTLTHLFYVIDKGWKIAEEMVVGDKCSLADGTVAFITKIDHELADEDSTFTTYNFEVEDCHTYFVGSIGIWVHNSGTYCDELVEFAIDLKKNNPHLQDHELIDIVFKKIKLDVKNRSTSDNIEDITKHFNDFKAMHFKYKYGPSRTSNVNDFTSHLRRINGGTDALGKDYPGSLMPGAKAPTHAHHIVMKGKNFPGVQESIEILERYDIDWYKGVENLVWAPNTGHTKEYAWKVYLALKEADNGGKGTRQKIIDTLKDLGEEFVKEHTSF